MTAGLRALRAFYGLGGVLALANAGWMLLAPAAWYAGLPAGVPDTGPLNAHFVRDIGVAFGVAGLAFWWCARHPARCRPVHVGLALFFGGHAAVHLTDLAAGRLPADHWRVDLPVFAPAVVLAVLSIPAVWRRVQAA